MCIAELRTDELIMAEVAGLEIMVELMTNSNNNMNVRFGTLCPLGNLPGLAS